MIALLLLIVSIWQLFTNYHWGWVIALIVSILWLTGGGMGSSNSSSSSSIDFFD